MTDSTTPVAEKAPAKAPASRGRKPADHQQKKGTAADRLDRDQHIAALLEDLPELPAATELRMRERGKIRSIMLRAEATGVFAADEIEVDHDSFDQAMIEKIEQLDELCAQIDEWAEYVAYDTDAYKKWSRGKSYDVFFAILDRYSSAVGESTGS